MKNYRLNHWHVYFDTAIANTEAERFTHLGCGMSYCHHLSVLLVTPPTPTNSEKLLTRAFTLNHPWNCTCSITQNFYIVRMMPTQRNEFVVLPTKKWGNYVSHGCLCDCCLWLTNCVLLKTWERDWYACRRGKDPMSFDMAVQKGNTIFWILTYWRRPISSLTLSYS